MGKTKKTQTVKARQKQQEKGPFMNPDIAGYILLSALVLFIAFIRIRLFSFPLERDEGEYAYLGQLILEGIPPYKMAYNMKFPGTYYSYALIMAVFGETIQGIRMGLLLFSSVSIILVYLITKKLVNIFSALLAAAVFGILQTSPSLLGQAAHANHFVTFYMLAGVYLLILAFERKKLIFYFFSGIMMGLALLMKQSGFFFPLFGGLIIILSFFIPEYKSIKKILLNIVLYAFGFIIPLAVTVLILNSGGVIDKFLFWTLTYSRAYGSRVTLEKIPLVFKTMIPMVAESFTAFWIIFLLGIIAVFFYPLKKDRKIFILLFLLFSILQVLPGFYFRNHYFIPLLPVLGIITAIVFDFLNVLFKRYFKQVPVVTTILFLIFLVAGLNKQKDFFFMEPPSRLVKTYYYGNPFGESIPVARYLKEHSLENDKVFVFGSEPQIYFYSHRRSATGYIYMYDLVFNQEYAEKMRNDLIREVEAAAPRFTVFISCPFSWMGEKEQTAPLFKWFNSYMQKNNYVLKGVADILYPAPTVYAWDDKAMNYKLQSTNFIYILEKITKK